MTKSLTEQWFNNTIDRSHHYYVRIKGKEEMNCGGIDFIDIIRPPLFRDQFDKLMKYNNPEVLAPVPNFQQFQALMDDSKELDKQYDKVERLEKQLAIATKALKKLTRDCNKWGLARRALKEIEEVK